MSGWSSGRPKGILRRDGKGDRFVFDRHRPSERLSHLVDYYWSVRWDLEGRPPFRQEILTHPSVQIVVEAGKSGVFGILTERATKILAGRGRAFGIKLLPGAAGCVFPRPVARLTDSVASLADLLGEAGIEYERAQLAAADDDERTSLAEDLLLGVRPRTSARAALARRIVECIARDPALIRVGDVCDAFDLSSRALQRLFNDHVGVTPKWVIRRYRMHDAVEALESRSFSDLGSLALRLGYFDHAHFDGDFRQVVGCSPSGYLRRIGDEAGCRG